jgi:non-homologous end joining protein Ku
LIRKKAEGEEVTVSPPESRKGRVIDLMEALKASLAGKPGTKKASARPAKRSAAGARRRASRRQHGGS